MRRFQSILMVSLLLPCTALSQVSEEEFLRLLEQNELATARERASKAYRQYPNSAAAAYFHALLTEEAAEAIKLLEEISSRFGDSPFAERAFLRLGQYHFANGTYGRARQYFLRLIESYPKSVYAPQAAYYAAKALLIVGNPEQAQAELTRCVANHPGTWMAKFAAEDLARLPATANHKTSVAPSKTLDAIYVVQAGSFSQRDNAVNQQRVFSQAGYPVEIREKKDARGTFYQVWVGEFNDRNQARDFADKLQRQYKLSCHVVKRE